MYYKYFRKLEYHPTNRQVLLCCVLIMKNQERIFLLTSNTNLLRIIANPSQLSKKTMTAKQIVLVILSALAGAVLVFLFNFLFLDKILIPDPCYYHSHDTNMVFDIFYDLPASDGYHPFPSTFNILFTAVLGAIIGLRLSFYVLRKQEERKARNREP